MISYVGREILQDCPAAVVTETGERPVFLINSDVWGNYTDGQKRFIMLHEIGHWILDTDDEEAADIFAAEAAAGTERDSLRASVQAVTMMSAVPYQRAKSLLEHCKTIDNRNNLNYNKMKQILFQENKGNGVFRADGESIPTGAAPREAGIVERDAELLGQIIGGNQRRRLGVRVNNVFINAEAILLAGILASLLVINHKIGR